MAFVTGMATTYGLDAYYCPYDQGRSTPYIGAAIFCWMVLWIFQKYRHYARDRHSDGLVSAHRGSFPCSVRVSMLCDLFRNSTLMI